MAGCCAGPCSTRGAVSPRFRRALWIALVVNAAMFAVEIAGGLHANSVALLADAVDFAGDAANYGLSLAVLSMGLAWRARAAWVKGFTMTAFGLFVAIPAVLAYNAFNRANRLELSELDAFAHDLHAWFSTGSRVASGAPDARGRRPAPAAAPDAAGVA